MMDADKLAHAVDSLVRLMARLRGPDGCPWDAQQTDATLKLYLLEEAYEVVDAIEQSSAGEVCSELGDLLFQIIFLAHLASERGDFDFLDVTQQITQKMIRRHPHVFGDKTVKSAEEVAFNWNEIKRTEKGASSEALSFLDRVPSGLPALLRAHRLTERASKVGFDWASGDDVWHKVMEEMGELEQAVRSGAREPAGEELGDLLFTLVNLARHWGYNAEALLRRTNQKFLTRFTKMEDRLKDSGVRLENATLDEMDKAWDAVKAEE
ncbi:MAG: nucleoside triphosphate pyrophosphohydrolase [Desulfatiglandaceae bacterium]